MLHNNLDKLSVKFVHIRECASFQKAAVQTKRQN